MSLEGASSETAQLAVIMNDLHRLKTLITVMDACDTAAHRALLNGAHRRFNGAALLTLLAPLIDVSRPRAKNFGEILDESKLTDLEAKIILLTDIHGLITQIPPKVFPRDDGLERLKAAAQQALDDHIAQEEELEDE